jgi:K319L-like, PKD domain
MRHAWLAILVSLSFAPSAIQAQGLSITNYQLVGQQVINSTLTRNTYTADVVNTGMPVGSVTANVTTTNPYSVRTVPGSDTLTFGPVATNGQVTSSNTITILVYNTQPFSFSSLQWTFQTTPASIIANAGPDQSVSLGTTVVLNGTGSSNPSGVGTLTYSWRLTSRPPGSYSNLQNGWTANPTFVADVTGSWVITLTVSNGSASSSDSVTISTANSPPVANAGPNQTVALGSTVTLNGSGSSDVDGDALTYQWTLVSVPGGSAATLSGATGVASSFVADKPGNYVASLTVNDGHGHTSSAVVTISTANTPPVANAGPNQSGLSVSSVVQLNGSGSTDVDGNPLTYHWSLITVPQGSVATLNNPSAVNPTFTLDLAGLYVAQLIVNDGTVNSAPSTVTITSSTGVQPPTANAGVGQTVLHGTTVQLNGSGTDPQALSLSYQWSFVSAPAGSSAVLSGTTVANPTFVADQPGNYVVQLIVNNGFLNSAPSTVTITTTNTPPVANAGPSQSVGIGTGVVLDGSGSTDADNDHLTYAWSLIARPDASTAYLAFPNTISPRFLADQPGTYVAQLIVNDGVASSSPSTVTIIALNLPAARPGTNQTVVHGATVQLSGSGTDPQNLPLTYQWSITSKPANSTAVLSNATITNPTFVADQPGNYTIQLIVNNGIVSSLPASVTITATNTPPVANAGPSQNVSTGATVTLNGGGSSDADHDPLTYAWTLTTRPNGSGAALTAANTVSPHFVADLTGLYVAQLMVSDGYNSSTATVSITATAPGITLTPNPLTFGNNTTGTLTVTLSLPAGASGQLVALTSGSPSVATVPAMVTVPAGTTMLNVTVTPGAAGSSTITASASGFTSGTAVVNVVNVAQILLPINFSVAPNQSTAYPVTLANPAPAGGVIVVLTSSDTNTVTISPNAILIPQGQYVPSRSPQVTGLAFGSAIISATAGGLTGNSQQVLVTDTLTFSPSSMTFNQQTAQSFTLLLSGPAPASGITISLSSSNPAVATVPATITIPGNATAIGIKVTGVSPGTAVIHASSPPMLADTTANVTIITPGAVWLPPLVTVGQWGLSGPLPVGLTTPAPAGGVTITLTSSDNTFISISPTSVFVPAGATAPVTLPTITGTDALNTITGSALITATAPGYVAASISAHVVDDSTVGLQDGVTIHVGQSAPFAICLPGAAPQGGVTLYMTSDNPSVVTISPTIYVPAGTMCVINAATVTGVSPGTVLVRETSQQYFGESKAVTVVP